MSAWLSAGGAPPAVAAFDPGTRMASSLAASQLLLLSSGLALFAVASLQDMAMRLVMNRIPLAIAAAGLALRGLDGTALLGLLAAGTVFFVAACCWQRGWLGGADVKLFGAGALLVPPHLVAAFVLVSCLAGGVLALAYAGLGLIAPAPSALRPLTRARRYWRVELRRLRRRGPLPYATAIAAGAAFISLGG